ncbi:MAG: Ig-like domain-containing protein [Ruminiclostridium sp.]|nr:Ig-like domain-containing protein [Ruminiclostridium sp.]
MILSVIVLVCCLTVNAGAITPEVLAVNKETKLKLLKGNSQSYTITTTSEGNISLDIKIACEYTVVYLIGPNKKKTLNVEIQTVRGEEYYAHKGDLYAGINGTLTDGDYVLIWNSKERDLNYEGRVTFHDVDEGTYTLVIENRSNSYGSVAEGIIKADYPYDVKTVAENPEPKIERFSITLAKGSTLKLGAIVSNENGEKVKWSSSNSAVASVTSSGKITAKKAGSSIITAKVAGSTAKIVIKVTS